MLRIVIEVYGDNVDAQGVKEQLAMELERFGDVRVVEVQAVGVEQIRMEG